LLYACIARVERIPLVTHDAGFDRYKKEITLIKPRELCKCSFMSRMKISESHASGIEKV